MPVEALNMRDTVFLLHIGWTWRIIHKVDPQNGRSSPFIRENVKKMCFSWVKMPVEALNMPGAVFPMAHRLKHV